jgi:hypothetical protein
MSWQGLMVQYCESLEPMTIFEGASPAARRANLAMRVFRNGVPTDNLVAAGGRGYNQNCGSPQ